MHVAKQWDKIKLKWTELKILCQRILVYDFSVYFWRFVSGLMCLSSLQCMPACACVNPNRDKMLMKTLFLHDSLQHVKFVVKTEYII